MSVFKRANGSSPYYVYEFRIQGRTFKGSTKRTTEREALLVERQKRTEAEQQLALEQLDPARTTVEQVFERYWKTHGSKLTWAPTLKAHMLELEDFLGFDKPFMDVKKADLSAALDHYAQTEGRLNRNGKLRPGKPSDSSVNRRLSVFSAIYHKARDEWELPVTNIVFKKLKRKEPKERVRHITREEAKLVLSYLPRQALLVIAWSLATGCRKNETRTLQWSRVNFETMQAEVKTKGGGTRFVELNDEAVKVLAECDRNSPQVFDFTNLRRRFAHALKNAGIEDFRFHDLRHSFATWLGNSVGDLALVMKALGHTEIGTTMKYRHVVRGDLRRAVQQLPSLIESDKVMVFRQGREAFRVRRLRRAEKK